MNLVRVVVDAFPTILSRINGHASMRPPSPPAFRGGGTLYGCIRRWRHHLRATLLLPRQDSSPQGALCGGATDRRTPSCTVEFMANLTKYQDAIDRFVLSRIDHRHRFAAHARDLPVGN